MVRLTLLREVVEHAWKVAEHARKAEKDRRLIKELRRGITNLTLAKICIPIKFLFCF